MKPGDLVQHKYSDVIYLHTSITLEKETQYVLPWKKEEIGVFLDSGYKRRLVRVLVPEGIGFIFNDELEPLEGYDKL